MTPFGDGGWNKVLVRNMEKTENLMITKESDVIVRRHKRGLRVFFHKKFIETTFPELPQGTNFRAKARGCVDPTTHSPIIEVRLFGVRI